MPPLSDKLKSLGVRVGAQDLPPPRPGFPIEQVVDGRFLDTPYGQAFVVETRYPSTHLQGKMGLQLVNSLKIIAAWANQPRLQALKPEEFIFLDTETSGLAGGSGTYAFLVGVGRLNAEGFQLAQYFMRDPLEEPAQLAALNGFLGDCAALVSFNGKAFDVPILNARFTLNGDISPFKSSAHLDLLPLARRLWRDRLPERRLRELERHILEMERSQEDVPGWLAPQLYFDYLRDGDARPLKGVFYHNAMDVVSLAALLNHIAAMLESPPRQSSPHAVEAFAIGKLYEDLGDLEGAAECYAQGLAGELPAPIRTQAIERWSLLEKRRGNWSKALELWQQAAADGAIFALVELAKYHEHRQRDYAEATRWTEQAIALVNAPLFPKGEGRFWLKELNHRLSRLMNRVCFK